MKLQFVAKKPSYKNYPKELNTLGDHLRKVRLDRNMSQSDVAQIIGVKTDTITCWELNRNEPTAKFAKKIIEFIGYVPKQWFDAPIHQRLYYGRLMSGKTQLEISKDVGIDYTTIQMIEKGARKPSRKSVMVIENFFGHMSTHACH